jgi:LPS sulfotransferase NodH
VHIHRRHKLRQALSTARALQTGLWKVKNGETEEHEPQFDAELIEQSLREAERQEKIWQNFFQRIGVRPFEVEYEKMCHDYEETIRSVLDFLRISLPRGMRIGHPVTVRQSDETSRMWEERFLAERPSAYSPAAG